MKVKNIIIGIFFILSGIGIMAYYDQKFLPYNKAQAMFREAKIIYERNDTEHLNQSYGIFAKIAANYPDTDCGLKSYFYIGMIYEKLGFYNQAFLKYNYILKNKLYFGNESLENKTIARMAHIKVLKNYSEEGINQLLSILNKSQDNEYRSKIYAELGHTLLKAGQYKRAEQFFKLALREDGDNEEAILGKARVFKRIGKDKLAYETYENFLTEHGNISQYTKDVKQVFRVQAYRSGLKNYRNGHYRNAIYFFKRVLKFFPGHKISENSYYWLGETYFSLGKYQQAHFYFNKVLNNFFYHKDEPARIKKGYIFFKQRNYELAAKQFQLYIHHYPSGRYIHLAKKWKEICLKEIESRNRGENFDIHKDKSDNINLEKDDDSDGFVFTSEEEKEKIEDNGGVDEVKGSYKYLNKMGIKLENVTEI